MPAGRPHHDPAAGFAELSQTARDAAGPGRRGGGAEGGGRPLPGPAAGRGAPGGGRRAMALLPALLLLLLPLAALAVALATVLLGLPSYDIPPGVNQPAKLRLVLAVLLGTAALVSRPSLRRGRGGGAHPGYGGFAGPDPTGRVGNRRPHAGGTKPGAAPPQGLRCEGEKEKSRIQDKEPHGPAARMGCWRLHIPGRAAGLHPRSGHCACLGQNPFPGQKRHARARQQRLPNGGADLSLEFRAELVLCLITALSFRRSHLAQGKLQPFNCSCRG